MMKGTSQLAALISSALFLSTLNATTLGEVTVIDPVMGVRSIVYEEMSKFAVAEGDILIGKLANIKNQGAFITPKVGGSRWLQGIVPYEVNANLPFINKLAILEAINYWQSHTNIEFVELTAKNVRDYPDYISFIPAEGTTCASYVGRKKGMQEIVLSTRCTKMITVHEIGHALGLWHEQSRSDRNSYIRIIWDNIDEEHKYNFDQHLTDGKDFGEYDYQSIMHYGEYAFSKNGQKTITPLTEGIKIGQRNQLSEKDIAAIKAMYPEA